MTEDCATRSTEDIQLRAAEHVNHLVENNHWDLLYKYFEANPDAAIGNHPLHVTRLHWLCSIGSVPVTLIDLVSELDPSAIVLVDRKYGDTCLHVVARNCQTSAVKLKCLLGHLPDKDRPGILIRNIFGGTALHSAANHNAVLETLQILIASNPQIIRVATFDGTHAISALWNSFVQTIPGSMLVARILEQSDPIEDSFFERFWSKIEFLALHYIQLLGISESTDISESGNDIVHGLLKSNVTINFLKVALKRNPAFALARDFKGNLPLHRLLEDRPYRLKERDAIQSVLNAAPDAAMKMNKNKDFPLFLAIRNRIPWENGVDMVAHEGRDVIAQTECATSLVPFQYAAFVGGKYALETTFQLLLMRPDLLNC
jgi:ankyrin repeat protein